MASFAIKVIRHALKGVAALSPETAGAAHLHALAAISRMMRDERMHEDLIAAPRPEVLYSLLSNVIERDAA